MQFNCKDVETLQARSYLNCNAKLFVVTLRVNQVKFDKSAQCIGDALDLVEIYLRAFSELRPRIRGAPVYLSLFTFSDLS